MSVVVTFPAKVDKVYVNDPYFIELAESDELYGENKREKELAHRADSLRFVGELIIDIAGGDEEKAETVVNLASNAIKRFVVDNTYHIKWNEPEYEKLTEQIRQERRLAPVLAVGLLLTESGKGDRYHDAEHMLGQIRSLHRYEVEAQHDLAWRDKAFKQNVRTPNEQRIFILDAYISMLNSMNDTETAYYNELKRKYEALMRSPSTTLAELADIVHEQTVLCTSKAREWIRGEEQQMEQILGCSMAEIYEVLGYDEWLHGGEHDNE